jgi:thiamine-monophosphate kinase
MHNEKRQISDVGEKSLIRDFIKPFFNADDDPCGVGDDCAMIRIGETMVLFSTDRVPADLTAFRLGILDFRGLGDYLARLNLSDIVACGGRPAALLLNLGLPATLEYDNVTAICAGFRDRAETHRCKVLGGDITSSLELSISATSIGTVQADQVLRRRGAQPGDSVFISRPPGMTPAAFEYFLGQPKDELPKADVDRLREQFTAMAPMVELGERLGQSGLCTSCMDNTDGIGQSLVELAEASRVSFVIEERMIFIPDVVAKVANLRDKEPLDFIFNGGADFSLIGTLRGDWSGNVARAQFGPSLHIIGRATEGEGVILKRGDEAQELSFKGWNYFL